MTPTYEEAHLAKGLMSYMAQISEKSSSRADKKIAESIELKTFLFYLSERVPSVLDKLLRSASRKCEEALRVEREARIGRKRVAPPNGNEDHAKRVQMLHPTEEETGPSKRDGELDLTAQPRDSNILACDTGIFIKQESGQESFKWTDMRNDTLVVSDSEEDDDNDGELLPTSPHKVPVQLTGHVNSGNSNPGMSVGEHIFVQQMLQEAQMHVRDDTPERDDIVEQDDTPEWDDTPEQDDTSERIRLLESEIRTPSSDSQYPEIVTARTSASEQDGQSSIVDSDEDGNAKPTEKESSSVATTSIRGRQGDDAVPLPTEYQIEVGLSMQTPAIEAHVKTFCLTLKPSAFRAHFDIHNELSKVLDKTRLLDFYIVGRDLSQYLENREKMPGKKLQARTVWNMSDPGEILDSLQTVKTNTADSKIHRAYGQEMLYKSVNDAVARGYKSSISGYCFDHSAILDELARKKAGSVSQAEVDRMISSYLYEYLAGQKWSEVIDWFDGSGIVLVFVTAGIGSHFVEQKWTRYQRNCLKHIAGLLHSIRGMVKTLGSDALKLYCRHGCLSNDHIDRVKAAEFTRPDTNESEDESDDESD